jgi:hypothetical protein
MYRYETLGARLHHIAEPTHHGTFGESELGAMDGRIDYRVLSRIELVQWKPMRQWRIGHD